MEVKEICIDNTTIKFFDNCILESMKEANLSSFETILLDSIKKIEKL